MKKQCKPCITIQMVYDSAIRHWKLFIQDVKDRSRINMYACEIDLSASKRQLTPTIPKDLQEIREKAAANYSGPPTQVNDNGVIVYDGKHNDEVTL